MATGPKNLKELLRNCLDQIESKEALLLGWGFVDGRISHDELTDILDPLIDEALGSNFLEIQKSSDLIEELLKGGLIIKTDARPYQGYRSRMAETVRLLARLRQLFPQHAGPDGWRNGRPLIADYRFLIKKRKYPKRNIVIGDAISHLAKTVTDQTIISQVETYLIDSGSQFKLSGFQVRSVGRILEKLEKGYESGTLISAGTGSGKTLAFYIPALAKIAQLINEDPKPWVKTLAIYPRNELLRDQFSEVYIEARKFDKYLKSKGRNVISIGCLFGDVPTSVDYAINKGWPKGWEQLDGGVKCIYMSCWSDTCSGDLIWQESNYSKNIEILHCNKCSNKTQKGELRLTRESLTKSMPDVVFTTAESMNRRLSDPYSRGIFGLGSKAYKPVSLVLLDEVHTYGGTYGAQIAFLLRRWKYLHKKNVNFIGLSATLIDGVRFFSALTGIPEKWVVEMTPEEHEMEEEGMEYMLAARGDPVSQVALLSATIQIVMLMMRVLDAPTGTKPFTSNGIYGTKTFVFADDIDIINRLYFALLDAEGRNDYGEGNSDPLSILRRVYGDSVRDRAGQSWGVVEQVGHDLTERKQIGRVSSQDAGVMQNRDALVATASLEVGFNDKQVGAVIQHKAPKGSASFIQRKGRAGRSRLMRPWTVTVLSGYGKDRLAYQGFERLFDPELPPPIIPISSRYIQKIQATFSLIDYLGKNSKSNIWNDLSRPSSRKLDIEVKLKEILTVSNLRDKFTSHLMGSLDLPKEEVSKLLWDHPRSLLMSVIPTILRRLSTQWRDLSRASGKESFTDYSPLPEFVPNALFSDLNLPEIKINIPKRDDPETMPIKQGLTVFAPGRISRRFGTSFNRQRHWVGPKTMDVLNEITGDANRATIGIDDLAEAEFLGTSSIVNRSGNLEKISVFRPLVLKTNYPPSMVKDTSNAQLIWHTEISPLGHGNQQKPSSLSSWTGIVDSLDIYLHANNAAIKLRRFTTGSNAEIKLENGNEERIEFTFNNQGQPAALGYEMNVDAIGLQIELPLNLISDFYKFSEETQRTLRTAFYFDLVKEGNNLSGVESPFLRRWVGEILFTAVTHEAIRTNSTLEDASKKVISRESDYGLNSILSIIFQSTDPTQFEDTMDDDVHHSRSENTDPLLEKLRALLDEDTIIQSYSSYLSVLWTEVDSNWMDWLSKCFMSTVGRATMEAIRGLIPDIGIDDLTLDLEYDQSWNKFKIDGSPKSCKLWISEGSPGGTGYIEAFQREYALEPGKFYQLMSVALSSSNGELVNFQLSEFLKSACEHGTPINSMLENLRNSENFESNTKNMIKLRNLMVKDGMVLSHGFMSALSNRLLRPGSNVKVDELILSIIQRWDSEEEKLGVELDAMSIAHVTALNMNKEEIELITGFLISDEDTHSWIHNFIISLLWSKGREIRLEALETYNPFSNLPSPERFLAFHYIKDCSNLISLTSKSWREDARMSLIKTGKAILSSNIKDGKIRASAFNFFAIEPIEVDYLVLYARLARVERVKDMIEIEFEIVEVN